MKKEYDLTKMKSRKNPHAAQLKQQAALIEIENDVVEYFKNMATETGVSYQNLINLYLRDCMKQNRKAEINFN
ncbi:MAG: antitoxin [Methylococcaceae bacterium]|nr:antitoxin [Methylococcaceae bacterium]